MCLVQLRVMQQYEGCCNIVMITISVVFYVSLHYMHLLVLYNSFCIVRSTLEIEPVVIF